MGRSLTIILTDTHGAMKIPLVPRHPSKYTTSENAEWYAKKTHLRNVINRMLVRRPGGQFTCIQFGEGLTFWE